MRNFLNISLLFLYGILPFTSLWCQPPQSAIVFREDMIVPQIQNFFQVVVQQEKSVTLEQLTAFMGEYSAEKTKVQIVKRGNYFVIQPDTIGLLSIQIKLKDTIETKRFRVTPMKAVAYMGRFRSRSGLSISINELSVQLGINAIIKCCGFDARCKVIGFESILASQDNGLTRIMNKGGRFSAAMHELFDTACRGDFIIFRDIKYRCLGTNLIQRLENMVFEIE